MKVSLLPFLLFISLLAHGQDTKKAKLDKLFNDIEAANEKMGSFSIAEDGKLVYHKALGYASLDPKIKADTATKYLVGSISKTFTATIILQMVHEGKLSLQDKLARFYPNMPQADETTIEHLLRHRSGIHNFGNDRSKEFRELNPQTKQEALEILCTTKPDFKPGSKASYNNANYVVLSFIAEEIDNKPFADVLKDRITGPLELTNTYLEQKINPEDNEAYSYFWNNGWNKNSEAELNIILGAGGITSTPDDLNKFFYALFQHKFFPEKLLHEMIYLEDGFGLGIIHYSFGNRSCYGHAGSIDAFESFAAYFPDDNISIALCINGVSMPLNDILIETLTIYFSKVD